MAEADRLVKYPMKSEAIENRAAELCRDVETLGLFALLACSDSYGMTRAQILETVTRRSTVGEVKQDVGVARATDGAPTG